jgi:hypothetical protein
MALAFGVRELARRYRSGHSLCSPLAGSQPLFALTAIVALVIGIGVNAVLFEHYTWCMS